MSLNYQERKAQGERKRAKYRHKMNNAEHLAIMFRGVAVGVGFMLVMGLVSNADRLSEVVLLIVYGYVIAISLALAEQVLFTAEQSRYPKSRRMTLRSEFVKEWREFRNKKS